MLIIMCILFVISPVYIAIGIQFKQLLYFISGLALLILSFIISFSINSTEVLTGVISISIIVLALVLFYILERLAYKDC